MVSGSVDRRDTVNASWKTVGDGSRQNAVLGGVVEALEEGEDFGIQGVGRVDRRHLLHHNMAVTLDDTVDQLLGSGKVGIVRVHKRSSVQIFDLEVDRECSVGRNGVKVLGRVEFGGRLPATRRIKSSEEQDENLPCYQRMGCRPSGWGYKIPS